MLQVGINEQDHRSRGLLWEPGEPLRLGDDGTCVHVDFIAAQNDFIAAQKESRAWRLCTGYIVKLQRNCVMIGAVTGVSHSTRGEGTSSGWQG